MPFSKGLSLSKLARAEHGVDLGPLVPCRATRVRTADGKVDLAVASEPGTGYAYGAVSVLMNTSVCAAPHWGTLGAPLNINAGSGAHAVAIGDFDRDGKPDLIVANSVANNVSRLRGSADGSFGSAKIGIGLASA